jgi:hypothetical protein
LAIDPSARVSDCPWRTIQVSSRAASTAIAATPGQAAVQLLLAADQAPARYPHVV